MKLPWRRKKQSSIAGKSLFNFAAESLIGDRAENQDAWVIIDKPDYLIAAVADGLGGHNGGALISKALCELIEKESSKLAQLQSKDELQQWLSQLQHRLKEAAKTKNIPEDARTTLAFVWCSAEQTWVAHIGDSRVYRIAQGHKPWRTHDHSVAQMLADLGEISEEELATHPDQGKLLRSIHLEGVESARIQAFEGLKENEALILCSDGFWSGLSEEAMTQLTRQQSLQASLSKWAEKAVEAHQGNSDNVTAVVVERAATQ